MSMFFRAYTLTGTLLGALPEYTSCSRQVEFNEVGAARITYPSTGLNASVLDADDAVLVPVEDGVEQTDWYLLEDDGDDPAREGRDGRPVEAGGRGALALLERAIIAPANLTTPTSTMTRTLPDVTPGALMHTFLTEAQARGTIPAVQWSFTSLVDSAGNPWPAKESVTLTAGTDLLRFLLSMTQDGKVDAEMRGLELRMYVPDTVMGVDRPGAVLRLGQSVTSGPRKRSRSGIKTYMLGVGDNDLHVGVADGDAVARYGRREGLDSRGGVENQGQLTALAQRTLAGTRKVAEGITVEYLRDVDTATGRGSVPVPGVDYKTGDYIRYDQRRTSATVFEPLRVRSIARAWSGDGGEPSVSVELNDVFTESSIRTARQVESILNGSVSTPVNPLPTNTPTEVVDTTIPRAPSGLGVSTDTYTDGAGRTRALVSASWVAPTQNTDNTAIDDLGGYEAEIQVGASPTYATPTAVAPAREDVGLRSRFNRRGATTDGWYGGDNGASARAADGKDWWLWADTSYGRCDSSGKYVTYRMLRNSVTITDPAYANDLTTITAGSNVLPVDTAETTSAAAFTYPGTATGSLVASASPKGGTAIRVTRTATGIAYALGGKGAVTAGKQYQVTARFNPASTATALAVYVHWFDGAGAAVGSPTAGNPDTLGQCRFLVTAPTGATQGRVSGYSYTSGGVVGDWFEVDELGLFEADHMIGSWRAEKATETLTNLIAHPNMRLVKASAEVRRNYCTSPTGSTVGAWAMTNGTVTTTGGWVRGTHTTAGTRSLTWGTAAAAAGEVWTVSLNVRVGAARTVTLGLVAQDSAGTALSTTTATLSGTTASARGSVTATMPTSTAKVAVTVTTTSTAAGEYVEAQKVLLEKAGAALPYFDGSTTDATSGIPAGLTFAWTGTADASASTASGQAPQGWVIPAGAVGWVTPGTDGMNALCKTAGTWVYTDNSGATVTPGTYLSGGATVTSSTTGAQATFLIRQYQGTGGTPNGTDSSSPIAVVDGEGRRVSLSRTLVASGSGNIRPVISLGTAGALYQIRDVTVIVGSSTVPHFDGDLTGNPMVATSWVGTANASQTTAQFRVTDYDVVPTARRSLMTASQAGGLASEFLWSDSALRVGGRIFGWYSGLANSATRGTADGWAYDATNQFYLAEWDTAARKLVRFERWLTADDRTVWGGSVFVDGTYAYMVGYRRNTSNGTFDNYVMRFPATDPWGTREYWTGTAWSTSHAAKASVSVTGYGISAVRKAGAQYVALVIPFQSTALRYMTAPAVTGPWTDQGVAYTFPDYTQTPLKYLAKFHPQFDTGIDGLAFSYCNNGDALNNNLTYVPTFLRGPAGALQPGSSGGTWTRRTTVDDTGPVVWDGITPATTVAVRVRALDTWQPPHYSDWVASQPQLTGTDTTGPAKPSPPTVEGGFRGVRVTWDGRTEAGAVQPPDFFAWQVHASTDEGFTPSFWTWRDTLVGAGGSTTITGLTTGVTWWVRVVAVDNDGNQSPPSDARSAATTLLSDPDLPNKLITGAKVADNAIAVRNLTVAAFDPNLVPNGGMEDVDAGKPTGWSALYWEGAGATPWSADTTNPLAGKTSLKVTTTAADSIELVSRTIPLTPGATYYIAVRARTSRAVPATALNVRVWTATREAKIGALFDPEVNILAGPAAPVAATGVTTIEGSFTVPAGMLVGCVSLWPKVDAGGAYDTWVDDVEVRKIVGEAAIANASIGNAKIKDLAVDNAKMGSVSAEKVTSGVWYADSALAGRFKAGTDGGARAELNSLGFQLFNAANAITMYAKASDGSLWMSGDLEGGRIFGGQAFFPNPYAVAPGYTRVDDDGLSVTSRATANLCPNPSFERDLTGVTAGGGAVFDQGAMTISDYSLNVDREAMYGQAALMVWSNGSNGYVDVNLGVVQPNTVYTVSWHAGAGNLDRSVIGWGTQYGSNAYMRVIRTSDGAIAGAGRDGYVILGSSEFAGKVPSPLASTSTGVSEMAPNGTWWRTYKTFTTPSDWAANTPVTLRLPVPRANPDAADTTHAFYYDGIQLEQQPFLTRYCDGDQPGCTWDGTRGGSTSRRPASKAVHFPAFGDPTFTGNVNAPRVTASRIKVGTGSPHGSNYVERFVTGTWELASGAWYTVMFNGAGGSTDRQAQDDGGILSLLDRFIARVPGFYVVSTTISFPGTNRGGERKVRLRYSSGRGAGAAAIWTLCENGYSPAQEPTRNTITLTWMGYMDRDYSVYVEVFHNDPGGNITMPSHNYTQSIPQRISFILLG